MPRQIYINLPVRDLKASMGFFAKLGFEFNKQFTDEKAACMIVNEDAYVMLLSEPFFKGFTANEICQTKTHTEALMAVSCESREAVDRMVDTAVQAGGRNARKPIDHGFMYGWSFYDLDGHHWEPMWMDPKAVEPACNG